jgi:hypothetical protein
VRRGGEKKKEAGLPSDIQLIKGKSLNQIISEDKNGI